MNQKPPSLQFPKRFLWGASTAAHQVEGGTHNQWSVWELEHAKVLANQAEYQANYLPKWDEIKDEATNPDNYISGKAVDHYNLYEKDFNALKKLNMNAFRFSIEWSRVEPEEGAWNAEAIEHYRRYLQSLKDKNIEPVVTLWHWTMPVWFTDKGGFEKRANIKYFVRFAEKVFQELGREFRYVITINEPETYIGKGYFAGEWPPMKQSKWLALRVYINLARAHRKVYKLARNTSRKFIVGLAKNCAHNYAGDDAWITRWSAEIATWAADYFFLNKVKRQLDFIGLNYYLSNRFYGYRIHNPDNRVNDLGWDMQPQNIQFVLERLYDKYKLPIIVTENGVADRDDEFRKWWLMQTLLAMHRALQGGVKLEGYLHWSLIDNFEWASGFWPKFGLIAVNRTTMERTARPSAVWLAQIIGKIREQ
jgi:beta-glucosidase